MHKFAISIHSMYTLEHTCILCENLDPLSKLCHDAIQIFKQNTNNDILLLIGDIQEIILI